MLVKMAKMSEILVCLTHSRQKLGKPLMKDKFLERVPDQSSCRAYITMSAAASSSLVVHYTNTRED